MSQDAGNVATPAPKKRLPRWAWGVIIVSLALNLVTVGVVAGSFLKRHHGPWSKGYDHGYFQRLPQERRETLRKILGEAKAPVRPLWKKTREAREAAAKSMAAEPFDEAAMRQALKALSAAEIAAREAGEDMLVQIVTQLSPEERVWYANKFRTRFGRHRRHERRGSGAGKK